MFDNLNPQQGGQPNQNSTPSTDNKAEAKPQPSVPSKAPSEPEDIFAGTDNQSTNQSAPARPTASSQIAKTVDKPQQFQPKATSTAVPTQAPVNSMNDVTPDQTANSTQTNGDKKYVIIGIAVIVVLVVVLISMIALAYYKANSTPEDISDLPTQGNVTNNQPENNSNQTDSSAPLQDNTIDNSLGLSNAETGISSTEDNNTNATSEGTDDNSTDDNNEYILDEITDTDKDGMTDGEERRLGTDPESSDTDGDGLFDREEIRVYKTDPIDPDTDNDGYSDGAEVNNGYNPNGDGKLYELP